MSLASEPSTVTAIQLGLDALNARQPDALEKLFTACRNRLRLMITVMMFRYSRLRRWIEHEDVLQEVEVKLLKALQSLEVTTTRSFLGLAATAIRRQLIDLIRKYRHHFQLESPGFDAAANGRPNVHPGLASLPSSLEGPWEEIELHELVQKLPDDLREVFELIYYHGMSHLEVARHLDLSISTSKHKFHDAKRLLGQLLLKEP